MDKQGLVAPVWSDSGELLGNVTYTFGNQVLEAVDFYVMEDGRVSVGYQSKPADPNAKPAIPALTRVSGNKRGPGWCDE